MQLKNAAHSQMRAPDLITPDGWYRMAKTMAMFVPRMSTPSRVGLQNWMLDSFAIQISIGHVVVLECLSTSTWAFVISSGSATYFSRIPARQLHRIHCCFAQKML